MAILYGSKVGIHAISPNRAIPLVREARARGAFWPVVKSVDNGGICMDVKAIEPRTLTIYRAVNAMQDAADNVPVWSGEHFNSRLDWSHKSIVDWTQDEIRENAQLALAFQYYRLNAEERAAVDWYEPLNEADFPSEHDLSNPSGWKAFGTYLIELVHQANAHGMKLALPGFNSGTPEWTEMEALASTGLFLEMAESGHILTLHEGWVGGNFQITRGWGDRIPDAPLVPGAGSVYMRYRYLYSLLHPAERVPLVISEWYGGPYGIDPAEQVKRFAWYDQQVRQDPYVLAFLPFTIDPSPNWFGQNYTGDYPEVLDYLVQEKDKSNVASDLKVADRSWYQEKPIDSTHGIYQVVLDVPKVAAAGFSGILHRLGIGAWQDPTFQEAVRRSIAARHAWGVYHVFRSVVPWKEQVDFILGILRQFPSPPMGFYADLEAGSEGANFFTGLTAYLDGMDSVLGIVCGIYSRSSYLVQYFTKAQQKTFGNRPGWWANAYIPDGWTDSPLPYVMRQRLKPEIIPGVYGICDVDDLAPGLTLADLAPRLPNTTPPPPIWKPALWGLHGRADGRMQNADWQCVDVAKIEALKLLSSASPDDFSRALVYKIPVMLRAYVDFTGRVLSASTFAKDLIDDCSPFYERGARLIEIHNEPNLRQEGRTTSWKDGREFGHWFMDVQKICRAALPQALFGWPGLSPGFDTDDGERADSERFLAEGIAGAQAADWIGMHCYFQDDTELDHAVQQVRIARTLFPDKPIYVTEFGNPSGTVDRVTKASQYLEFVARLNGLASGAFAFVVSASNQEFAHDVWRDEAGNLNEIPAIIGARIPQEEGDMTTAAEKKAMQNSVSAVAAALVILSKQVDAIVTLDLQPAPDWWTNWPNGLFVVPKKAKAERSDMTLYLSPSVGASSTKRTGLPADYTVDVYARQGEFFKVTQAPSTIFWVRAIDLHIFLP